MGFAASDAVTAVNAITPIEANRLEAEAMTEAALSEHIRGLCREHGWLRYHTWHSRKSASGFPDEVAVHPVWRRTIFAELKREPCRPKGGGGRYGQWVRRPILTSAQAQWLDALSAVQPEVYLWLPRDWVAGTVQRCLIHPRGDEHDELRACRWSVRRCQLDELGIKVVGAMIDGR